MAKVSEPDKHVRAFLDGGHLWDVREYDVPRTADAPHLRCLVFSFEFVVRQVVYEYPADWYDLSDTELRAMMDRH
jgi:hypothetical protein